MLSDPQSLRFYFSVLGCYLVLVLILLFAKIEYRTFWEKIKKILKSFQQDLAQLRNSFQNNKPKERTSNMKGFDQFWDVIGRSYSYSEN